MFFKLLSDFGYDISDYLSIQPEYGTMDDFNDLIVKAKELGNERKKKFKVRPTTCKSHLQV